MALSSLEGENHIGNASINAIANSSFPSIDVSSFKRLIVCHNEVVPARLYQAIAKRLITNVSAYAVSNLATRLVSLADSAQVSRHFEIVDGLARLIFSLPVSFQLQDVGRYYQALSLSRSAGGDITRAGSLFEEVANLASSQYRAKAMLALGTNSVALGDHKTATSFYRSTTRILDRNRVFDPMTLYTAARMTAVMKSIEGDHRGALVDLEKMVPLVRVASSQQPYAYYDYLNTVAVELTHAARLDEAGNASQIALASPFAPFYPEWRETYDEIGCRGRRASRSTVAIHKQAPGNKNLIQRDCNRSELQQGITNRDHAAQNLVTLRQPCRDSLVTHSAKETQPPARVIKFPIRTPSTPQQGERQGLEPLDKRGIVSEKLYEMFMSALDDEPVNRDLVEELYKTFLKKRKQN